MEKLYYTQPFCRSFSATVTDCESGPEGSWVTLDRTAFYPEGGGQPADQGTLGGVNVTWVREREGQVEHLCTQPLEVGAMVEGVLDWPRRFDHMQAHSGEHIVSGLIHSLYGYENVGFHMGADGVTIDFDGPLTQAELHRVETMANDYIWQDEAVEELWPSIAQLAELEYRSKKALEGAVRIIRFPGGDTCACCGTHVLRAGQVGLVKLLGMQSLRGGVRMGLLAGRRALEYLAGNTEQNRAVARLLSLKGEQTAQGVERLKEELAQCQFQLAQAQQEVFQTLAKDYEGKGAVLVFREGLSPDGVRRLADALAGTCGGRAAVFSGREGDYQYAVALPGGDLRDFTKAMNAALNGRGGGKPHFVQGSLCAGKEEIQAFFGVR